MPLVEEFKYYQASMMMLPNDKGGLNIVPFIDIMLVLLAIVLSISTFIANGQIKVDLPTAKNAVASNDEKHEITISKDSEIFLNDKKLDVINKAFDYIENSQLIVLKVDKDAPFESFVKVLDELKSKGHENLAINAKR